MKKQKRSLELKYLDSFKVIACPKPQNRALPSKGEEKRKSPSALIVGQISAGPTKSRSAAPQNSLTAGIAGKINTRYGIEQGTPRISYQVIFFQFPHQPFPKFIFIGELEIFSIRIPIKIILFYLPCNWSFPL